MTAAHEPDLATPGHLRPVLEALREREPIFHRPACLATRAQFLAQTDDDFWEVGASGRRYSRAHVLAVLEERWAAGLPDAPWEISDLHLRALAPDTFALTYTLHQTLAQGPRVTRRLTLWRREEGGWKICFHQGTVVVD